jgi:hypothetical protein
MPLLHDLLSSPYRWGDLQFIEGEVIVEAVHTLTVIHGVPALPVHDSIIVPISQRAIAEAVLSAASERHVGIRPFLEAKR